MVQIGSSIALACSSFAITNIDDAFVLVTFFAEASNRRSGLTPARIVIGQYVGFTVIITISLIGFGASYLIPTEPLGFMGLLPLLLGVWKLLGLFFPRKKHKHNSNTDASDGGNIDSETSEESTKAIYVKSILKVASVTVMNGADNIGTYVPLFSQARNANIAVYVVVYYILLGLWCLAAFLIMRQKVLLGFIKKYMRILIPFLYVGLGLYIVIRSSAYPWAVRQINRKVSTHPGAVMMSVLTCFVMIMCMGVMLWIRMKRRKASSTSIPAEEKEEEVNEVSIPLKSAEAESSTTISKLISSSSMPSTDIIPLSKAKDDV